MEAVRVREALRREPGEQPLWVAGWVRTRRDSKGGFSFVELNDGSCLKNLQVVAGAELANYDDILRLTTGSSLEVEGLLVRSPGRGQAVELRAQRVRVLGGAPEDFPLQKKRHGFEFLREIAHLRTRGNTFGAVWRVRNALCRAVHEFFQDRGFQYVHTPIITPMDCEGAGELFRVSTIDPALPPRSESGGVDYEKDFFGRPAYLTVSGQLEAEALACALGRVYTFGPTFRAENSNTARHLSEFWMVEPEMAFCDLDGDMDVAESFLKALLEAVLVRCPEDLEFFEQRIEPGLREKLERIRTSAFTRISYDEAIDILGRAPNPFQFPAVWGNDLQTEHERYLTEETFHGPVVVYNYPRKFKPFYMYLNPDGRTVRAMDVLVPRTGEIIGGSQREDRFEVLRDRMQELGMDLGAYAWYLDLRRFGTVPHAGFGLGLDRFVQFVTGMQNIRDVIPFPRTPGSVSF